MTSELAAVIITALVGGIAAMYGAYRSGQAAEHTPYGELARRVVALEKADRDNRKRIAKLETSENKLLAFLDQLIVWIDKGADPPPPIIPDEIRYVIDRRYK